ncbi:TRAP transporter large permease [Mangrovicoccus ximenensis]|uniref:TRAP transporter large permease n=1 Tax=Mangrovicoccus ximenensis TaxID=1911570 RepID=UPI000D361930|nr:TRAP transporter large permease subunit [Mangrovicoccus ximenensis]
MIEHAWLIVFGLSLLGGILSGIPVMLVLAGVPVLLAFIAAPFGGFDLGYLQAYPQRAFGVMSNSLLLAVPLFVLMGILLEKSRVAERMLMQVGRLLGGSPRALVAAVLLISTLIAASTGIIGATIVMLGLISLPAMRRVGVPDGTASGLICAAGTLGQIIPPSIVLILLGDQVANAYLDAQQRAGNFAPDAVTIGDLFAGALIPGLVLVALYGLYVVGLLWKHEASARSEPAPESKLSDVLREIVPPILLILAVLGSVLAGVATPTEAAAIGVAGTILITAARVRAAGDEEVLPGVVSEEALTARLTPAWLRIAMSVTAVVAFAAGGGRRCGRRSGGDVPAGLARFRRTGRRAGAAHLLAAERAAGRGGWWPRRDSTLTLRHATLGHVQTIGPEHHDHGHFRRGGCGGGSFRLAGRARRHARAVPRPVPDRRADLRRKPGGLYPPAAGQRPLRAGRLAARQARGDRRCGSGRAQRAACALRGHRLRHIAGGDAFCRVLRRTGRRARRPALRSEIRHAVLAARQDPPAHPGKLARRPPRPGGQHRLRPEIRHGRAARAQHLEDADRGGQDRRYRRGSPARADGGGGDALHAHEGERFRSVRGGCRPEGSAWRQPSFRPLAPQSRRAAQRL